MVDMAWLWIVLGGIMALVVGLFTKSVWRLRPDAANAAANLPDVMRPTGIRAEVSEPIPPRGYGEIRIAADGGDILRIAACYGREDVIPAGAIVIVEEWRDDVAIVVLVEQQDKNTPAVAD